MRRAYCFTDFDWEGLLAGLQIEGLPDKCRYLVMQQELCPDTGRLHMQGYVELTRSMRISQVKSLLSQTAHFEVRRGTRDQARAYCMKEDTRTDGPWEFGDFGEGGQGKRTDLMDIKQKLDEGRSEKEIADEHFSSWCRYRQSFKAYKNLQWQGRDGSVITQNIVIYGEPGVGKTQYALEQWPDAYWKPSNSKWFDDYAGQSVIIYDDFNNAWFPWDMLMGILDSRPMRVESKGSSFMLANTVNVFTTNTSPLDWYRDEKFIPRLPALLRRLREPHGYLLFMESIPNGRRTTKIGDSDFQFGNTSGNKTNSWNGWGEQL